jgi:Carboxypeptidase regulatory-like domain
MATTVRAGRYRFTGLEPGRYEVDIDLPPGYSTYGQTRPLNIPNPRACAEENYGISPDGRVSGRVVDKSGRGIVNVRIEITGEDATVHPDYGLNVQSVQSDADGYFEVRGVSPGRYIVGVNLQDLPNQYRPYARQVYPGNGPSTVIELTLGQVVDLGQWELAPPLAVVPVSGWITWKDGAPAGGVYVSLWDATGNPVDRARGAGGATSGPDGHFVIEGREGRVYTFVARPAGNGPFYPLSHVRIEARPGLEPVRLVIERDR